MAKKVKCSECTNSMNWALPGKVGEQNYEYAKHCLHAAMTSIVCGEKMRTKAIGHEQYCKKYRPKTELEKKIIDIRKRKITELENQIAEYEALKMMEDGNEQ